MVRTRSVKATSVLLDPNTKLLGKYYAGFDSQVNDSWLVVLDSQGKQVELIQLPLIVVPKYGSKVINIIAVCSLLSKYEHITLLAEEIKGWGMGSKGAMTFGSAVNLIGQLSTLPNVELSLLAPSKWKMAWGLDSNKNLSIALASEKGLTVGGTVSHNLAESFLLARFVFEACTRQSGLE